MTARAVDLHPEAIREAAHARAWYAERSPAALEAFVEELDRAIDLIGESPQLWPKHLHGTRRYLLRRFPYGVIYRELPNAIEVVAVAHCRRRPGYWKGR
jgi:plasmid stabilization system protein ParE